MTNPSNTSLTTSESRHETVEDWSYPFPLSDAPETPSVFDYLNALSASPDGTYPIGRNGIWHGGIHFGSETWARFAQAGGALCIADGEVVAYRLDSKLQSIEFPRQRQAGYSAGFTLVRHRLVLPPAPTHTPRTADDGTLADHAIAAVTPEADILVFFSLYMHTLCWDTYEAAKQAGHPKPVPSYYYRAREQYAVGKNAKDIQTASGDGVASEELGLRIRDAASSRGKVIGWMPCGTVITISSKEGGWGMISTVVIGAIDSAVAGEDIPLAAGTGWVFLDEMEVEPQVGPMDRLVILDPPSKIQAGDVVAHVGEFQRLIEANEHGTLVPHVGERMLLHVETFTGQDLPSYIRRSQERVKKLPFIQRTMLLILKGAKLAQPSASDGTITDAVAVKETADSPSSGDWCEVKKIERSVVRGRRRDNVTGDAFWVKRSDLRANGSQVRKTWSSFPLSTDSLSDATVGYDHVTSIVGLPWIRLDAAHIWYYVTSSADSLGAALRGWVCSSDHPAVALKSPWEWPGFVVETMATSVSDMFKRALHIAEKGEKDEIDEFAKAFDASRGDATIKRLESSIDVQGELKGKMTAQELSAALKKPWLADLISHLVIRYESEWGGTMEKWKLLTPLMHAGTAEWGTEMKRIETLRFWAAIAEGSNPIAGAYPFPPDPNVYHIHPIALVGNFAKQDACACGCCLVGKIQVNKYHSTYGPVYWGAMTLDAAPALKTMLSSGEMSASEGRIIIAMAPNEGKLDSVQSYDNQVITAGAMQKTITPEGKGELSVQVAKFRAKSERAYQELFVACGWTVEGEGRSATMYFSNKQMTDGLPMTGVRLRTKLREGCSADNFRRYITSPAVAALAHAISDPRYQELQISDFVLRLREFLAKKPDGYNFTIGEYFQNDLGRAAVLDQCINRPAYVTFDMKTAIDHWRLTHVHAAINPNAWQANRAIWEREITEYYGRNRRMVEDRVEDRFDELARSLL